MTISDLKTATLKDIAKDYKSVIQQASNDVNFHAELRELFRESCGDENIAVLTAHPDAFLAFEENGLVPWHVLTLDLAGNASKLARAGYPRSEVVSRVAMDFYSGSIATGESPAYYQYLFKHAGAQDIERVIRDLHPELYAPYIPMVRCRLYDLCLESFETDRA